MLVLGITLLAYLIGQDGPDPFPSSAGTSRIGTGSANQTPSAADARTTALPIAGVSDFDPVQDRGNGTENPELAPFAIDGNPATSWETLQYFNNPKLGLLKPGVGLVVDLGHVRQVGAVKVSLGGDGTTVELRAAPESATTPPSSSATAYTLLGTDSQAGSEADFTLDQPVHPATCSSG